MNKNTHKGFTLIELLVVVAIIGILSGIVLAALNSARTRSREGKAMGLLTQVRNQMEIYSTQNGNYGGYVWGVGTNCATTIYDSSGLQVNVFTIPHDQGGLIRIIDDLKTTVSSVDCATGPYYGAYQGNGAGASTYAVMITKANGERVCIDSTTKIRTYASNESPFLWGGLCQNY